MAVNSIILELSARGISATQEHEGGTWSHTPEYVKRRYSGGLNKPAKQSASKPKQDDFMALLDIDVRKMTKSERQLLLAKLKEE